MLLPVRPFVDMSDSYIGKFISKYNQVCKKGITLHKLHLRENYDLRGYSVIIPRPLEELVL
jgi:hypothetical protein